jgi:regulator of protease activity HflC (stomatin/prohibitin superfamily)
MRRLALGEADATRSKAQGVADATRIQAAAQSEALQLIAQALAKDKNLITYEYVQKLSPGIRVMLVPNNAPFILPLPTLEAPAGPITPTLQTTGPVTPTLAAPATPVAPPSAPAP